jgi:dihydrofolate synthase / folylpolyglutamate synthase
VIDAVLERLKRLHPKVIDLALDRVDRLLAALGHPEGRLPPVVHVAGTNGKGSTLAYLRAMVEAAGGRAHVYTSPHLVRFAERIRVAGQLIGEAELLALLEECEAANAGQPITFFEVTTAAALLAFARREAELCLLETGLGGRFDATNVVERPRLTILTPISLDHQAFLGDTLGQIAGEKAGILKAGVPCVCARQDAEALAVIDGQAARLGVPLLLEGRDWTVEPIAGGIAFAMGGRRLELPQPVLPGAHQMHNAALAVAAACALGGVVGGRPLPEAAIAEGLRRAQWPARLQRLTHGPLPGLLPAGGELWLDGGHNPAAGLALAAFIGAGWRERPLDLVVGMLNTKDSRGFLDPLGPLVRRLAAVTIPGEANALAADGVVAVAAAAGIAASPAASLTEAVSGLAAAEPTGRVLICGSLYLAGVVLAENG